MVSSDLKNRNFLNHVEIGCLVKVSRDNWTTWTEFSCLALLRLAGSRKNKFCILTKRNFSNFPGRNLKNGIWNLLYKILIHTQGVMGRGGGRQRDTLFHTENSFRIP